MMAVGIVLAGPGVGVIPPVGLPSGAQTVIQFGMDAGSLGEQLARGLAPDLTTVWVGVWNLRSGWGGTDARLEAAAAAGVVPVIQFYYWGDDIGATCLEQGCWSTLHGAYKDRAGWDRLADELVEHLWSRLGGRPVIIVVESEFNKGTAAAYEPLDGYLEERIHGFHARYPAARAVLALGNWGHAHWPTWDRAGAASDYVGIQAMRGSTRHTLAQYLDVVDATIDGARRAHELFARPVFVTDVALSSHPEPEWATHQADALAGLLARLPELRAVGVEALVYRSLKDTPSMDTANYFGEAERHWGLLRADGSPKPGLATWLEGVGAARAGTPAPPEPPAATDAATPTTEGPSGPDPGPAASLTVEAESFETRSAGGRSADASASGGMRWNLWSNGYIEHRFEIDAPGRFEVVVRALGDPLDGVAPRMDVRFDGGVAMVEDPKGDGWHEFAGTVPVPDPGLLPLRIEFMNDAKSQSDDRNLLVDWATVRRVGPL